MKKELNVVELTCMGVGGIVGAGIFVISGQAAATYAGPAIVLSFALAGMPHAGRFAVCEAHH